MNKSNLKKFMLGTVIVGGMMTALLHRDHQPSDEGDDQAPPKKEIAPTKTPATDPYNNVALFNASRSHIKFALTFVENYYEYVYFCGKAWTTGSGLTILYNADGTSRKVTPKTKVPNISESDVFVGRYLTFETLSDIQKYVTVPMDQNTLLAVCVFRYCVGSKGFRKSLFLKKLNAGKTGAELAKTLTRWRQDKGVLKRCYFFAALLENKITFDDLLPLRTEGCYNLDLQDIVVHYKGKPKIDKNDFYEWDYSKLQKNLKKAKNHRATTLNLGNGKKVTVKCKLVKETVPDYIWQDVTNSANPQFFKEDTGPTQDNEQNEQQPTGAGYIALGAMGVAAAAYAAGRKHRR